MRAAAPTKRRAVRRAKNRKNYMKKREKKSMKSQKRMKKEKKSMKREKKMRALAGAALAVGLCMGGVGCARKVYVPVEHTEVRTDTVVRLRWRTDSVVVRDSVSTEMRGDTVVLTRVRDRWRSREVRDTLWRTRCDTVVQERIPAGIGGSAEREKGSRGRIFGVAAVALAVGAALPYLLRRRLHAK